MGMSKTVREICFKHKTLFPETVFIVDTADINEAWRILVKHFKKKFGVTLESEDMDELMPLRLMEEH